MVSLATADAILLAITFPPRAQNEHITIITAQKIISFILLVGTTSSIIYASIHGIKRSITVPVVFTASPAIIRKTLGFKYFNIRFILSCQSFRLFFQSSFKEDKYLTIEHMSSFSFALSLLILIHSVLSSPRI